METQIIPDIFFDPDDDDNRGEVIAYLQVSENFFPLFCGDNIIGRVSVCDVVVDSVEVSDRHAEIHIENDIATIKDFRSRNGTFVNQVMLKRNEKISLKEGDIIRFGSIDAIFSFKHLNKIPNSSLSENTQEIPNMLEFAKNESMGSANANFAEEPTLLDDIIIENVICSTNSIHDIVRDNGNSKSEDDSEVSQDLLCMDTYAGSDSHSSPDLKTTAIRSEAIPSVPVAIESSISFGRRSHVMTSLMSSTDSDSDTDVEVEAHNLPINTSTNSIENMLDKSDGGIENHEHSAGRIYSIKDDFVRSPENRYPSKDTLQSYENIHKYDMTTSLEGSNKINISSSTKTTRNVMNLEVGLENSQASTDSSPLKLNFSIINSDNESDDDSNILLDHQEIRNVKFHEEGEVVESLLPGLVESEVIAAIEVKDSKEIITESEKGINSYTYIDSRESNSLNIYSTNAALENIKQNSSTSIPILDSNDEIDDKNERSTTTVSSMQIPSSSSSLTNNNTITNNNTTFMTDKKIETEASPSLSVSSVKIGRGRKRKEKNEVLTSNKKIVQPSKRKKEVPVVDDDEDDDDNYNEEEEEQQVREIKEKGKILPPDSDHNISSKEFIPNILTTTTNKNNKSKVTTINTMTNVVKETVAEQVDLSMGSDSKSNNSTKRKRGGGRVLSAEKTPHLLEGNSEITLNKRKATKGNSRNLIQTLTDMETSLNATATSAIDSSLGKDRKISLVKDLWPPLQPTTALSSSSNTVSKSIPVTRILPKRKQSTIDQFTGQTPLPVQEAFERVQTTNATKPEPLATIQEIREVSREMAIVAEEIGSCPVVSRGRKRGRGPTESVATSSSSIPVEIEIKHEPPLSESTVTSKDTTSGTTTTSMRNKRGGKLQASQEVVVEEIEAPLVKPSGGDRSSRRKVQPPPEVTTNTVTTLPIVPTSTLTLTPINLQSQVVASATSMVSASSDSDSEIRLIFTGIEKDQHSADKIGAVIVDDPKAATHMISVLPLKRTPKLMVAINSGIKYIISEQWLIDSVKAKQPIDLTKPRYCTKYLLLDEGKEKLWGFSMIKTLQTIRGPQAIVSGGGVFSGLAVFICEGVCGHGAPPPQEMKAIIESGGGHFIDRIPNSNNNKNKNNSKDENMKKLIVIANENVISTVTPLVKSLAAAGPGKGIYSTEFIFLTVLRQKLDFSIEILEDFSSPPPSKRKKAI